MELKHMRRVVTGHNTAGKSVVMFDGPPSERERNDSGIAQIWATDFSPVDNQIAGDPALRPVKLATPPGGSLFWLCKIAPMSAAASSADSERNAKKALERFGAGDAIRASSSRPDMHATKTLDYAVVLSGEVTLILDEAEVTLKPFDTVVQRGTNHTWENRGTEPALIAFVLLDAQPIPRA
ncbi:MAG TPA: cupin domain-containing protein [Candidatus Binataceae bacterium]|nr:cupin domain-containing protein [Candidatus Binataceae bacterium]